MVNLEEEPSLRVELMHIVPDSNNEPGLRKFGESELVVLEESLVALGKGVQIDVGDFSHNLSLDDVVFHALNYYILVLRIGF